jgi:hypothetical protein
MTRTIDQLLDQARARLRRLDPHQVAAVAASSGLLVDIRAAAQRAEEGEIPGAIIIERNVLEWRLGSRWARGHGRSRALTGSAVLGHLVGS